jgi:uncharacterized protein (TIGR00304 family)
MNKYHIFSLIFFIIAIFFFISGVFSGDVQTGIFVVFPFIIGSGIHAFIGMIFLFISILFFIFGFGVRYEKDEIVSMKETSVKGGGVVLLGPFPIVFGSNWKIALILMIVAIILIIVMFLLLFSTY